MPTVDIEYNGGTIASLEGGEKATLSCAGKRMLTDIKITAPAYTEVDNLPVTLDFSSGRDQVVDIPDGAIVKSCTIVKPYDLLPENIKQGKVIAGVVGTHLGGSSEPEITVLLEPMVIGPFATDGSGVHPTTNEALYGFSTEQAPVRIEKGKTYIVDWDGVQYTVVCKETSVDGLQSEILYLGDGVMLSSIGLPQAEPSEEPFAIMQATNGEDSAVYFITTSTNVTHTFGLSLVSESGGISDSRIHYVTFMHDGVEIYKMPVVNTDTCHDPVTKGYIFTPTKESTEQYNYSFSGWSLIDGGSANSSALANVTEDKTVYAAFEASTRYYTITFLDDDGVTVLKTESRAYGSTVGFVPEKSGYGFLGWEPSLAVVTGDASYVAIWEERITFANGAWSDIVDISEAGQAEEYFKIGDTRVETFSDGKQVELRIVGFNHDDLTSGNGKAGMTIMLTTIYKGYTTYQFAHKQASYLNSLAGQHVYGAMYNRLYGYQSLLDKTGAYSVVKNFPTELINRVKQVKKECQDTSNASSSGVQEPTIQNHYFWAPSLTELNIEHVFTEDRMTILGSPYAGFAKNEMLSVVAYGEAKTSANYKPYWTRSVERNGYVNVKYIKAGAVASMGQKSTDFDITAGLIFGFCI